jgi:hypothetical protein
MGKDIFIDAAIKQFTKINPAIYKDVDDIFVGNLSDLKKYLKQNLSFQIILKLMGILGMTRMILY